MERLHPLIQNHISFCYEQLCRDFVKNNASTFNCLRIGRQWSDNYELDIAGVNTDLQLNIVGECKWSHKKIGLSIYRKLQDKITANKLPVSPNCRYLLFSNSGFTQELKDMAQKESRLLLINSLFENLK